MNDERSREYPDWAEHRRTDVGHVRKTFAGVPAPVVALAAMIDDVPAGMIATSFGVGVSHAPPMCTVSVQRRSSTWPLLATSARIGISVLAHDQADIALRLASRDTAGRFVEVPWTRLPSGAVTIYGAPTWLECTVARRLDAGDHHLLVLEVHGSSMIPGVAPLIHFETAFGTFDRLARAVGSDT